MYVHLFFLCAYMYRIRLRLVEMLRCSASSVGATPAFEDATGRTEFIVL